MDPYYSVKWTQLGKGSIFMPQIYKSLRTYQLHRDSALNVSIGCIELDKSDLSRLWTLLQKELLTCPYFVSLEVNRL